MAETGPAPSRHARRGRSDAIGIHSKTVATTEPKPLLVHAKNLALQCFLTLWLTSVVPSFRGVRRKEIHLSSNYMAPLLLQTAGTNERFFLFALRCYFYCKT